MITDVSAGFIRRLIGFAEHPLPLPSGCQKNHSTPASFWFFPLRDLVGTGIPFILSSKSNTSSRELAHEDIYTESQQHIP